MLQNTIHVQIHALTRCILKWFRNYKSKQWSILRICIFTIGKIENGS